MRVFVVVCSFVALSLIAACGSVAANACDPDPCLNGGTCIEAETDTGFVCDCPTGFEGDTCETEVNVDSCAPNPCLNGGTCTDGPGTMFTCACAAGFEGTTCEINTDDCTPNPCQNMGVCTDQVDGFSCACMGGWSGPTCEQCQATPVTKDFTNQGTLQTPMFDQGQVAISGSANVNVLNLNGLGIVGGNSDTVIDGAEFMRFVFDAPATGVAYFVQSAGNLDGNGTVGDARIEVFNSAGMSLGTMNVTSTGMKDVSAVAGGQPISSFTITARVDSCRISSLVFNACP